MSTRPNSPRARWMGRLFPSLGLAAALALTGCWTEEEDPVGVRTGTTEQGTDNDGSATADRNEDLYGAGSGVGGDAIDSDATDSDATDGVAEGDATDNNGASSGTSGDDGAQSGAASTSGTPSGNRSGSSTASGSRTSGNRSGSSTRSGTRTSTNRSGSSTTSGSRTSGNRSGSSTSSASRTSGNRSGSSTASGSRTGGDRSGSTDTGGRTSSNRGSASSGGSTASAGSDDASTDATARTSGNRSGSGDGDDGVSMGMELPAVDDWSAGSNASRFTGADWQKLREDRVITVMNEPGPGTDPGCYPRDVLPMAQKGKLTKDQVSCVQKSLSQAEYDADKARLSLVLVANAHARGESDNWEWLVARHLETIDEENPGLAYRYALHLYDKGPGSFSNAYHWAGVALGQRAAWTGDVYHERVTRLYKLRAALSQAQWRTAEQGFAEDQSEDNGERVIEWRDLTRKAALDWYTYAAETGMDTKTPYDLCSIASIDDGCEGVSQ